MNQIIIIPTNSNGYLWLHSTYKENLNIIPAIKVLNNTFDEEDVPPLIALGALHETKEIIPSGKENKIIEGNPDKIKFVTDSWKFTKNINNKSPNWYLSEIISQ